VEQNLFSLSGPCFFIGDKYINGGYPATGVNGYRLLLTKQLQHREQEKGKNGMSHLYSTIPLNDYCQDSNKSFLFVYL